MTRTPGRQLGHYLGLVVAFAVATLTVLLLAALAVTAARAAWWLVTDHPLIILACATLALVALRKRL